MYFPFLHSLPIHLLRSWWPKILRAATWTILLSLTVAVASFAPEIAFVSAISPSSWFSSSCKGDGLVRLPTESPMEVVCLPAYMVRRSNADFFVPTVVAGLVVAASACLVRSLGSWATGGSRY